MAWFSRESDLRLLGPEVQALVPELDPAFRTRLLRFVLVHQSLRLEVASAALQVHVAAQARSAFSRQVGVVGFDVHRLRLLRLCARQRGRSLRQREGTAALLPSGGKRGR